MTDEEAARRAEEARMFMANPLWDEMWMAYHDRIHKLIDEAKSEDTNIVMGLKRRLALIAEVRSHCTAIVQHGKPAAEAIRLEKERKRLWGK